MCTSYYLEDSTALKGIAYAAAHHRLRSRMMAKIPRPVVTQGEVKRGDIAPVIAPDRRGEGQVFPMAWGFTGKHTLIATLDLEVLEKTRNPVLLDAWTRHRCLIPTSWYYEWERLRPIDSYDTFGDQTPECERRNLYAGNHSVVCFTDSSEAEPLGSRFMVQARGSSVTMLAGLYRIEELEDLKVPHFLILTQEAFGDLRTVHDRMPVIFDTSDADTIRAWLSPGAVPPWDVQRVIEKSVTDVIFEEDPPRASS
ncbi:MAG: SOS response-associated peptidase family protein [Eubacteriales bacterium]|nr:SOS response-associated peptidase family protein [Eubacteriales bacterium]